MGFSRRLEADAGTEGLEKEVQPQWKHIVSKYFLALLCWDGPVGCGEDIPQFVIITISLLNERFYFISQPVYT